MKAGLYARVSKEEQHSLNQLIELRDYAKRRGCEVEEFIDQGLSGSLTSEKRPQLKRMLEAARFKKIDLIVCWRLDRFARSLKQLVDMMGDLEAWNVGFTTLRENIDTTTPSGRLVFHLFAALAQFERDLIIERTNLGLKRALSQGKILGRPRVQVSDNLIAAVQHMPLRLASRWLKDQGVRASKDTIARWKTEDVSQKPPLKTTPMIVGKRG